MAKVVDITEKLDLSGNPVIKIRDKELEVKSDVETALLLMGKFSEDDSVNAKNIKELYEMIFTEKARKEIEELNLQFNDFCTVVKTAINLIVKDDEEQGE